MDIAKSKRRENIAEYILYLWQLEDLLRALQFSPEAIFSTLIAPRIFTAGADFKPSFILRTSTGESTVELTADDQFLHSIERFKESVEDEAAREEMCAAICRQAAAQGVLFQKGEGK